MQQASFCTDHKTRLGLRLSAWVIFLSVLLSSCLTAQAIARENPMLTLLRNSVYGSACGLLLGGVLTLVVDSDDRSDVVRWGVVIGTFSGFAYGVYELNTGGGYEEFTARTWPDIPAALARRSGSAAIAEPDISIKALAFPLRAASALGRSHFLPDTRGSGDMRTRLRPLEIATGNR